MENFTNPIDSSKLTPMEQELILGRANSDSIAPETNTAVVLIRIVRRKRLRILSKITNPNH